MPFRHSSCVVVLCDACGHDGDEGDDYGVPHWPSEAEALKGWTEPMCTAGVADCDLPRFHTMPDGRVLCRRCAHQTLCTKGHDWGVWSKWFPAVTRGGDDLRYRDCGRCGDGERETRPALTVIGGGR